MKISFGARYINSIPVLKKVGSDYKKQEISFVELDMEDARDMNSLNKTNDKWGEESYLSIAKECMEQGAKDAKRHLYMATEQADSFECLDEKKVLGAVVFDEGKRENHIELLQVEPNNLARNTKSAKWRRVGTSIVNNLQQMFSAKPMTVFSAGDAIGFYKKTGFVEDNDKKSGLAYVWNA
ncbi:GNAT family N-acetyltransferase [bacterium]|nr:GNAT family N-acetyltransferase [bacterium]